MSRPQRTTISGTFFVTAITANRRRIFQREVNALLFLKTLQHYRGQGLYKLYAFVVMPDHVHLLLTTEDLPRAMKHIRGGFSHELASAWEVWQKGYADHLILNREEFESRRGYIHQNPVRKHLVNSAEDYPYSSAFRRSVSISSE
jgi:putative transposase